MRPPRQRFAKTFDELIAGYYRRDDKREAVTPEDVIRGYYARARARDGKAARRPAVALTLSRDDGEVLQQPKPERPAEPADAASYEEYVVCEVHPAAAEAAQPAAPAAPVPAAGGAPAAEAPASREHSLDVRRPLEQAFAPSPARATAPPPDPGAAPAGVAPSAPSRAATVEEDELAADMQAILSGQKVYDPATGTTVERDALGAQARGREEPARDAATPAVSNEQAIFDRIAENMKYANAYDLGTVELENRFASFDRQSDLEERRREEKVAGRYADAPAAAQPRVGTGDFLEDLDAIRERAEDTAGDAMRRAAEAMPRAYASSVATWTDAAARDATCRPSALNLRLAEPDRYARPMYDAGEHAQAGGDLYVDQLLVGRPPGVRFSYGQLIAMADLYETVDLMMEADPAELTRLKELIDRSTSYYKTGKTTKSLDVSNDRWNTETGGRYLQLAERNSEHFAPNTLFDDAIARAAASDRNHKAAWEAYHRRAIEEAQKLALAPENANRSYIPIWPLIVNAFGDHFLTDAFASGHLINKEVMIAYFRASFFSGGSLTSAAKDFFARVAEKAFVGDVRKRFSVLETADYPVCAFGWCFKWHPNIDTTNAFRKLLLEAAEQEPEKVANFAVKALHDHLNEHEVEVVNDAGDGPWPLTGDEFLNPTSLRIMEKAVRQSIANVTDPSILQSNLDFGAYFERVWRYVPKPTPASRAKLIRLVREYTNPASRVLSDAAAEIIREQVDSLIKVLIEEGKLKPA